MARFKIAIFAILLVASIALLSKCYGQTDPFTAGIQQATAAHGTTSQQLVAAQAQIAVLQKQLAQTQATDTATIASLNAQIDSLTKTAANLQGQINAANSLIAVLNNASTQPTTMPTTAPAGPADVTYTNDATYYVATWGDDATGTGSTTQPYCTNAQALAALRANTAVTQPAILDEFPGVYDPPGQNGGSNICFGAWHNVGDQRPVWLVNAASGGWGYLGLNPQHVHFQNISFAAGAGDVGGVYVAGGNDVTLDHCEIEGMKSFGVDAIGEITGLRIYRSWIGNTFDPNTLTQSCSGLYTEAIQPDIQGNVFFHNGWRSQWDGQTQPYMFRHNWYENPSSGWATPGIDQFNLYLRGACTGHMMRPGNGKHLWCVDFENGNAADTTVGAGWNATGGGEVGWCALLGSTATDFAFSGGGWSGESVADNMHDLWVSVPSGSMTLNPPVRFAWTGGNNATKKFPLPAGTTATLTNVHGWHPIPTPYVGDGRVLTSVTNYTVHIPPVEQHVPTIYDWATQAVGHPVTTDQQLAEELRALHNPRLSAQACIQWLSSQLPQN